MCGIVAVAGDLTAQHEKVIKQLLILDSLRGEDSTGIVAVSKHLSEVKVAKSVGDPFQLFDNKSFDKALTGIQRCIIGHNRYATTGAVNKANAHPFEHNTVVGVHNGTIKNKWQLEDGNDFKVDSDALYHHIDKKGVDHMLTKADGAWALVWWDKVEETLNLLRNQERPLHYCTTADKDGNPDGKVIFIASEPWMLAVVLNRNAINYTKIEELKKDIHFSIAIEKGGKLGKPNARPAPGTFQPAQVYQVYTKPQTQLPPPATNQAPKDAGPVVKTDTVGNVVQFDRAYLKAKNVLFEVMEGKADPKGDEYLILYDAKQPYKEIRLYAAKKDAVWDFVGGEISADILNYCPFNDTPGRGYYKANAYSVRCLIPSKDVIKDVKEEKAMTVRDAIGRELDEEGFKKRFKECSWCSSPLVFRDGNKFTAAGECFCPQCAREPQVTDFVKFQ